MSEPTVRESALRVRLALRAALGSLERMQEAVEAESAREGLRTTEARQILSAPAVTEAVRTVVTRDGALLAEAIERALVVLSRE